MAHVPAFTGIQFVPGNCVTTGLSDGISYGLEPGSRNPANHRPKSFSAGLPRSGVAGSTSFPTAVLRSVF